MNIAIRRTPLFFAILLAGLLTWTGCDSGNEEEDANVSGTYSVTSLSFRPDASALPAANVLNTLNASSTTVQFFANGRFSMVYTPQGTSQNFVVDGTYDVDGNRVDIEIGNSFDDEREELLLPREFTLRTTDDGATLTGEIDDSVNLENFGGSDVYDGLGEVNGTLFITLQR